MHAVDPRIWKPTATKWDPHDLALHVQQLMDKHNCSWVTLSGGNPAMYDFEDFVLAMNLANKGVSIETQGTFCPDWLALCDYVCCSPKGPGMGERFERDKYRIFYDNLVGHPGFYVKIPIFLPDDLRFASNVVEISDRLVGSDRFYLSLGNPYPPGRSPDMTWSETTRESVERYIQLLSDIKSYPSLAKARVLPQLQHWIWGNEQGH
jgi:organic radical activating enzyme